MDSLQTTETASPTFLFITCQVGAERALKAELAARWPGFTFAFSRPGFLTFKLPAGAVPAEDFDLRSTFARAYGFSLGKTQAATIEERAADAWKLAGDRPFEALHVLSRDAASMGYHGFEPHVTPEAEAAEAALRVHTPAGQGEALTRIAQPGQLVLDCVLVEPDQWWIGYHRAASAESCLPGAIPDFDLPENMVSRAYIKMEEALAWSGLPIKPGQKIVEIGCAPGGASQALLGKGLQVIGIDPAEVDACVLSHPKFTHIRKRGVDVRRSEFRGVTWLASDMNVAPQYTLDTVEAIVTHPAGAMRGLLLTLKLPDWELAAQLPEYLERIRSWGFSKVRARQLVFNRREVCVTAVRRIAARKKH